MLAVDQICDLVGIKASLRIALALLFLSPARLFLLTLLLFAPALLGLLTFTFDAFAFLASLLLPLLLLALLFLPLLFLALLFNQTAHAVRVDLLGRLRPGHGARRRGRG